MSSSDNSDIDDEFVVQFLSTLMKCANVSDFSTDLKSRSEKVNWEVEKERCQFFDCAIVLIKAWEGQLPNFRDILRTEQIDWLLTQDTKGKKESFFGGCPFIKFVIKTGYKDEPVVDTNGQPLLRRTTPIHHAYKLQCYHAVSDLFKIYDRYDLNYIDESGLTHFHVACRYGSEDVVEKFLELGQDPNVLMTETGDSPLHLAMEYASRDIVELLLRGGADPNVANKKGWTPLHILCNRDEEEELMNMLFDLSNHQGQPVQVDAQDKLGRTPLQWAVANFMLSTVNILLDRGADVSSFVYPTESYLGGRFYLEDSLFDDIIPLLESEALIIVERLEERGYKLDRRDVQTIMKYFDKYGFFERTADLDDGSWRNDEDFAKQAKKVMMSSSLSLYDLIRLPSDKAEKFFTHTDYSGYTSSNGYWYLSKKCNQNCVAHLSEIIMRSFCRRWALESLLELTSYQLPILCCEVIIEKLRNKDLCHIFLAAMVQNS